VRIALKIGKIREIGILSNFLTLYSTFPIFQHSNRGEAPGLRCRRKMTIHSHHFVETYEGLVGFGADRETDENTVVYYLQKCSDDRLRKTIAKRLSDEELFEIFDLITRLLKKHLVSSEYHQIFLKEDP
jgi:hypothetical protein